MAPSDIQPHTRRDFIYIRRGRGGRHTAVTYEYNTGLAYGYVRQGKGCDGGMGNKAAERIIEKS